MKTKIVYVLVSNDADCYYEQTILSTYSLRQFNPDAVVEVVCDLDTYATLVDTRYHLTEYVDRIICVEVPTLYSLMQKSRYLKTKLRELITGDFLYLDSDTIICGSLDEIDHCSEELAAVRDKNRPGQFSRLSGWPFVVAKDVGWQDELKGEPYYNGGVMYAKDSPIAHQLYAKWHDCWLQCVDKGISTDQTGLCMANKMLSHPIKNIPDRWNCQINADGILFTDDALVIHYFCNKYEQYLLSRASVQETIKQMGTIPPFVKEFIANPKLLFASPSELSKVRMKQIFQPLYRLFRFFKSFIQNVK